MAGAGALRYCEPPPDPLDASPAPRPPSRLMWVKVSRPSAVDYLAVCKTLEIS